MTLLFLVVAAESSSLESAAEDCAFVPLSLLPAFPALRNASCFSYVYTKELVSVSDTKHLIGPWS